MDEKPVIFGWAADPSAGDLVERFRAGGKVAKYSDPRIDILIDIGLILGQEHNQIYYEIDKMEITRAISQDYTQYTVHIDDGLVFDVLYGEGGLELGEYIPGVWSFRIETLAKGMRRGRNRLMAETC